MTSKSMLTKLKAFVKNNLNDILIVTTVILISLFSFAAGYLLASDYQQKEQIKIEAMPISFSTGGRCETSGESPAASLK